MEWREGGEVLLSKTLSTGGDARISNRSVQTHEHAYMYLAKIKSVVYTVQSPAGLYQRPLPGDLQGTLN